VLFNAKRAASTQREQGISGGAKEYRSTMNDAAPSVKSAMRVFEILEHFKGVRQPLRLTDLAAQLGYPVSSTAALIKTLVDAGYFRFDSQSRAYFPTPRLSQLTDWIPAPNYEEGPVLDAMHQLQQSTGEMIVLGTPIGVYIEYVNTLRSSQAVPLYAPPGTRRLLVQTGMGWLMLSRMSETAALNIYRRTIGLRELTEDELSRDAFLARIGQMRQQDHAFTHAKDYARPTAHWSGAMMSMLLPVPPKHRRLAIGIGGVADRLEANIEHIRARLRAEVTRLASVIEGY
jgi:DNA-binding IclR family transcriptional regulator